MKAVPPREDRLVLEVIGVARREPANSSSVVAFRWLASEHGAPWSIPRQTRKKSPQSDGICPSPRADRSPGSDSVTPGTVRRDGRVFANVPRSPVGAQVTSFR
jgi:hypothetical protein